MIELLELPLLAALLFWAGYEIAKRYDIARTARTPPISKLSDIDLEPGA